MPIMCSPELENRSEAASNAFDGLFCMCSPELENSSEAASNAFDGLSCMCSPVVIGSVPSCALQSLKNFDVLDFELKDWPPIFLLIAPFVRPRERRPRGGQAGRSLAES